MTVRNLEFLFRPRSVAVISGTGTRRGKEPDRYAEVVLRNLAAGGFSGQIMSVGATRRSLFGMGPRVKIDRLEVIPELAIVCAAFTDAPGIIAKLGALGTRAVIFGPSLRNRMTRDEVAATHKAILDAARPHMLRVLGPGSGGLLVPSSGLSASVATVIARPGKIALVAQSTAVAAAVLERASDKGIGFSSVVHLGASIDIDLADILDWLAADPETEAILVQFDAIEAGRKFMSAGRAAARNKPVVAIHGKHVPGKTGDRLQANLPFATEDVYQAALRRAGWVGIDTLEDLFDAAEAMARVRPMEGERLSIIANGHGLARIAADTLLDSGGRLAKLSDATIKPLGRALGTSAPLGNPLVLPADVTPEHWAIALAAVLADGDTDAVLTVCSPSPFAASADVARAVSAVARASMQNVFTCWVGGSAMLAAQRIAAEHRLLSHDSPEKAIAIFRGIVNYQRNRRLLMQMPPSLAEDFVADTDLAHITISEAGDAGAGVLSELQARRLLRAYGMDAFEYPMASSIDAAILAANCIGYPVDLGLVMGGSADPRPAMRGLRSPTDIQIAARGLRDDARRRYPGLRILGYRLSPSAALSGIAALRMGAEDDPVFGPVIYLGPGSSAGNREHRAAVALPPLNLPLARDLVTRSRFAEEVPDSQREALETAASTALVRLSQLLTDFDEITGIVIDPLHVETSGVLALDARIRIEKRARRLGFRRFAIRPYPKELEQSVDWNQRKLLIRPIRPEDETTLGDLIASLDAEDARMRFFGAMRSLPRSQLARFTQIDYDREMALVAIERDSQGAERSLGEVRAVADPDNQAADFAIVVRSDIKGKGLGRLLLASMIDYCRARGTGELRGETLAANQRMQHLAMDLGFTLRAGADMGTVELRLALHHQTVGALSESEAGPDNKPA